MKKLLLVTLVAITGGLATGYYLSRVQGPNHARGAELVPLETLLFLQLPDLDRTAERWAATALNQLLEEPEIQALLERPRKQMSGLTPWQARLERWRKLSAKEAFVALTSIEGPVPQVVAGVNFSNGPAALEELLAEPRAALLRAHPTGKLELVRYGAADIEVFSDNELTVARAIQSRWCFFANSLELLEHTLDRLENRNPEQTLAASALFAKATEPVGADRDALFYAQLGPLSERVSSLLAASGQKLSPGQLAGLKQSEAFAAATKLEGSQFRDTMFVVCAQREKQKVLERHALKLSSPETLLFSSFLLPEHLELPSSALAMGSVFLPWLGSIEKAMQDKGLTLEDLGKAFGPEMGAVANWPENALSPGLTAAIDVRDAVKAKAFVELVVRGKLENKPWKKDFRQGVPIYVAPVDGLTSPALALTDRFLVFGFNREAIGPALSRLETNGSEGSGKKEVEAATLAMAPASKAYGYIDLRGLFERAYGTFRPLLAMSLAFAPEAGQYIDAGKLPATETIARHLGPIVFSQSTTQSGILIESIGPLTLNQVLLGAVAGSLSAALPSLRGVSSDSSRDVAARLRGAALPVVEVGAGPAEPRNKGQTGEKAPQKQ